MKNKILFLSMLNILSIYNALFSLNSQQIPHIITFFIRPLPTWLKEAQEKDQENTPEKSTKTSVKEAKDIEKFKKKLESPEKMLKSIALKDSKNYIQAGIYSSYAGYVGYSDLNGQTTFPRKTVEPKLYFLVTQDIQPVVVSPLNTDTILGFIINPKAAFQYYLFDRKYNSKTQKYNWIVTKEDIPADQKVPYNTIILFTDPKNIVIHTGSTDATINTAGSENLVLPDIYITKNSDSPINALRLFKIKKYFEPIKYKYEFKPKLYQQRVSN